MTIKCQPIVVGIFIGLLAGFSYIFLHQRSASPSEKQTDISSPLPKQEVRLFPGEYVHAKSLGIVSQVHRLTGDTTYHIIVGQDDLLLITMKGGLIFDRDHKFLGGSEKITQDEYYKLYDKYN